MSTSARFAKWGLGLFLFGVFLSFGVIAHYCVGARWPTGELFAKNITLWWACPWTLSVAAVQAGGLGMVAIGVTQLTAQRLAASAVEPAGPVELVLCVAGLLGVFAIGYAGYFVFDAVWPAFYYAPVAIAKNVWLLGQAFFIAVYFSGAVLAFGTTRRALGHVS